MPRKSAASLAVYTPERDTRPPPPETLPARQRVLWEQITRAKPVDWFLPDTLHLLAALVTHIDTFELVDREFRGLEKVDDVSKLVWLDKLSRIRDRESKAVASLSTKLRITQQSRYTPKAAGTAASKPTRPRPWEESGG